MGKETIDSLVIEIGATSEKASDGIDSMLATLERLKGIVNAAGTPLNSLKITFDELGNVKGASAALKKVGDTIKTTKPDYSSLASEIQGLAGDFASLSPEATKMVNATAKAESALRALSGVKVSTSVDDAADALKRLKSSLDVGDVKGVASAFADLPPSMQKSVTAAAKLETATSGATQELKKMGDTTSTVKDRLGAFSVTLGNLAADGIRAIANGVGNMVSSLVNLDSATEEYRASMGKLTTAFESAGYGPEVAKDAYSGLYAILGDTDQATEAGQLVAKLSNSAEDMSKWTDIAAGVAGTFGDALPIEGLIEAANETVKTGTVTGQLADALNWAGISEDSFNEALAGMTTEAQRNKYIMDTLSKTYDAAADSFYKNNEAIVRAREAQASLDAVMGNLGGTISNIKTGLMADFLPSITSVVSAFDGLLTGTVSATEFSNQVSAAFSGIAGRITESLPTIMEAAGGIIGGIVSALTDNLPQILSVGADIVLQAVSGITSALPEIATTGITIITTLATSLAGALPELIPQAVEAVITFAGSLIDNVDQIIDAGMELIGGLVEGILDSVPTLVAEGPTLVIKLVESIIKNVPKILESGVKLVGGLVDGLVKAVPKLVSSVPKLISAIVRGFTNGMSSIVNIGKDIVSGVWKGIQNMASWITDKVKNFFGDIVSSVKGLLGIKSPSKVFGEIGGFMAEGLGMGWDNELSAVARNVKKSVSSLIPTISVPVVANAVALEGVKASSRQTAAVLSSRSYASAQPSYSVPTAPAVTYEVSDNDGSSSGWDVGEMINAMMACTTRMIEAMKENGGATVYLDGKDITSSQNRQNRMYGRTLQKV